MAGMIRDRLNTTAAAFLCCVLIALAGCGGSGSSLTSIEIGPPGASIAKGLTTKLIATGIYSDGSKADLTAEVSWSSSDSGVVSIGNGSSSPGLATARAPGSAIVTASMGGVSGTVSLNVTAAALVSIGVTPASLSFALGLTSQLNATGIYTDNSTQNITASVNWSSAAVTIVSVGSAASSKGLATAAGLGSTVVTATLNGVSASVTVTVTGATLVSVDITPAALALPTGLTHRYTATGVYSDHSTHDLTGSATWSSSASAVATVSNAAAGAGLVTAISPGSAIITAGLDGISGTALLTVTAAMLVSVEVTPANATVNMGLGLQYTATGVFSDNSMQNLTATAIWSSSALSIATISNASGYEGLVTTVGVGSVSLTATLGTKSGSATLNVAAPALVSIGVTPANSPPVARGLEQQFTAIGVYADNSTQNLTASAAWSSSAPSVAAISNAAGSNGLATALSQGSTTITASFAGVVSASVTLAVSSVTLVSIAVTPANAAIAAGTGQQFAAIGTFSDGSTQVLTTAVTWASSDATVASVSNAPEFNGTAAALAQGSTTITAMLGSITGTTSLTVTPATLVSIAVTPANASVPDGMTEQFTATGMYSDGSAQDLTAAVTWSSSAAGTASISNAAGSQGLATALAVGSTSIGAALGGVVSSTPLSITSATLVSIAVTPASATVANGSVRQFTATGTYTDHSTQNLTASVTWSSSATTVATISNAAGSEGLATAAALGSTSIGAASGSIVSAPVTLTVSAGVQYAYVTDNGDDTVSQYSVGAGGALSALSPATVASGVGPDAICVDPTGSYAFVANSGDNTVSQYTLGAGGALVAMNPASIAAGNYPQSITVDPTGRYVYVVDNGDNTVSQYTIGAGGTLTPMSSATVATGGYPQSIAIDPTGRYAYVVNASGTLSEYTLGSGGALTPMSPASVPAGTYPQAIAIDPTGRYAYVANGADDTLSQYLIAAGGALTPMSPSTVGTDVDPQAVTVDPTGRYVYVANQAGTVSAFTIGTRGALTAVNPAAVQSGDDPQAVAVDLSGQYVYVANEGDNTLSEFSLGIGGVLGTASSATIATGSAPDSIVMAY